MTPLGLADDAEEQSEAERLEIARRYRVRRTEELRELAQPHLQREVREVGEFSTLPLESLAAIPILGAFFAVIVRARQSRKRLTPNVLLALDADELHLLTLKAEIEGRRAELVSSWPRTEAQVTAVEPKFMRERVTIEIGGRDEPLRLFATTLRTNPWAAGVVRGLGGDAPEPLDLTS